MAEFCKQCSIYQFGVDCEDFKGLGPAPEEGHGYLVLCEGCGPIQVNHLGECLSKDCLVGHNLTDDECWDSIREEEAR